MNARTRKLLILELAIEPVRVVVNWNEHPSIAAPDTPDTIVLNWETATNEKPEPSSAEKP